MDCNKISYSEIHRKTVNLPTSVIGTSFTQSSRNVGNIATLFGITGLNHTKVVNLCFKNAALTPSSMLVLGLYYDDLWIAATQNCTLSSSIDIEVLYTD